MPFETDPAISPYFVAHKPLECATVTATTAIAQSRLVGYAGEQISTAGVVARGIAERAAAIGDEVAIAILGQCVVEAGAALAVGAQFSADTTGRANVAVAGHVILGRVLRASTGAGQYILVEFHREGILPV